MKSRCFFFFGSEDAFNRQIQQYPDGVQLKYGVFSPRFCGEMIPNLTSAYVSKRVGTNHQRSKRSLRELLKNNIHKMGVVV